MLCEFVNYYSHTNKNKTFDSLVILGGKTIKFAWTPLVLEAKLEEIVSIIKLVLLS